MSRNTGPTARTRTVVKDRAKRGGTVLCEICAGGWPEQIHHRLARGMGGSSDPAINRPANLLTVCSPCHLMVESQRERAYRHGWLVHRGADPLTTPVRLWHGVVMLDNLGGMTPALDTVA